MIAVQADLQRVRIASQRFAITGAQGEIARARQVIDRLLMNRRGLSTRTNQLAGLCATGLNSGPPRRFDLRYPLDEPF